jgi:hypothetical protein
MAAKNINPNLAKVHRSYTAGELAAVLKVHKNSVRQWQLEGLRAVDRIRPFLFKGDEVRRFLRRRNSARKRPCQAGTLYCFRCREPRPPALGMADYVPITADSGNLRALCGRCETMMHRRVRFADLAAKMPGIEVQIEQAQLRLKERPQPSSNCYLERQATS